MLLCPYQSDRGSISLFSLATSMLSVRFISYNCGVAETKKAAISHIVKLKMLNSTAVLDRSRFGVVLSCLLFSQFSAIGSECPTLSTPYMAQYA